MKFRRIVIGGLIGLTIISQSSIFAFAGNVSYQVEPNDTYWKISDRYDLDLNELLDSNSARNNPYLDVGQTITLPFDSSDKLLYKVVNGDTYWKIASRFGLSTYELLSANTALNNDYLEVGDIVIIPQDKSTHIVQSGETYWKIAQKYNVDIYDLLKTNNAANNDYLEVGDKIIIPSNGSNNNTSSNQSSDTSISTSGKPYITYKNHTVKSGETQWTIAMDYGLQVSDLYDANGHSESTVLDIGDVIKIPVHNIPVTSTPGDKYGEYLDWWTEAQYVVPINAEFKIVDFYTGKSFMAKRTIGANHSDTETLTAKDTAIYKELFGGFSWKKRPVVIEYNGRKIAASIAGMPHAGNESALGGVYSTWRSGDYGAGTNFDYVKNNNMDGHFDLHFKNSTRHKDGQIDPTHQSNIKIAAGK